MKDQLPPQPNDVETGIINFDDASGPGTHWVAYAIVPRAIVYFDSYGLAPPKYFMRYIQRLKYPIFYSTLPTQQLNDPPRCDNEVLSVLDAISSSKKPPHQVVNQYISGRFGKS